ncbi:hypothetical protein LSAT2_005018 [Lamellibrachia satsuma]|nr:hypothetical protein LSAT2_005018 [Lamellibrachia satsuma]
MQIISNFRHALSTHYITSNAWRKQTLDFVDWWRCFCWESRLCATRSIQAVKLAIKSERRSPCRPVAVSPCPLVTFCMLER